MIITIPGKPIAKARPRFVRRGKFVATYNPQETEEGRWLLSARHQITGKMDGPIAIKCVFYMPRPKGHYGTGKNKNVLKSGAPKRHISKPDIDNLQKMVFDCLNQEAWTDDALICEVSARKEYSVYPRTEIEIEEAN
jgi:Holliday junction resolvase RusA-like endonuclease